MTGSALYSTAEYLEKWARVKLRSAELGGLSLADRLTLAERDEPGLAKRLLDAAGPDEVLALAYARDFWLREKQLAALRSAALMVLFIAARRSGKTRTASEWVVSRLLRGARAICLLGPTENEIHDYMLGGTKRRTDRDQGSGLFDVMPWWIKCELKNERGEILFPQFGAVAYLHSAEVAQLVGYTLDTAWCDEIIKWRYAVELMTNLRIACSAVGRLETQILVTSSPKRRGPRARLLRDLVMDPDTETFHAVWGENIGNVSARAYDSAVSRMQGSTQGDEDIYGELGLEESGDLFPIGVIDRNRVAEPPTLDRIVVGVDPAGSKHRKSDETGIVVVGRAGPIDTGHGYVLDDRTKKYAPEEWGDEVFAAAERWGASAFVLERNKFADMVASNIRACGERRGWVERNQEGMKYLRQFVHERDGVDAKRRPVKATRRVVKVIEVLSSAGTGDKVQRAEPVSTLYKTDRIHHPVGRLPDLDAEISEYDPEVSVSPNRLDALVHAIVELFCLDRPTDVDNSRAMRGIDKANARLAGSAPHYRHERLPMKPYRSGRTI